ncbi:Emopamil-binding protein [Teratosphaeria nubilosa]|uniref:Emopamil-binding protein n=1 Tax=Teratosphaeria nubilosa TaxID=161662 RepID=A0A6G1LDG6_9PEZI|nr:Emopamil-binding protein [Teratosphaeria nubilosa]
MADTFVQAANVAGNVTKIAAAQAIAHPYYPLNAEIPSYAANEWSVPALLSVFFGACTLLFTSTYFLAKRTNPHLKTGELLTIMWFVLSGAIHIFFEGYYATNYATLGAKQTLIGQMWKEYAFSDSRYLTKNSFVLCMETVTAVCWGPGCLIVAWLVVKRSGYRFPVQMVVSMGQFYGDALYYATSIFDHAVMGISYSRPEAYYYFVYFVLMNAFWILIPGYLMYQSTVEAAKAIAVVQRIEGSKKAS